MISVLVNGSPCRPFQMQRGLRQGDPLSPYLFILMTEVLNCLISKAVQHGLLSGLQVGSRSVTVTHLQFADDTLIFCEPSLESLQNIKNVTFFLFLPVLIAKLGATPFEIVLSNSLPPLCCAFSLAYIMWQLPLT